MDSSSTSEFNFCYCLEFKKWYEDKDIDVCTCGHPEEEHINLKGTCVGEVEILYAR